MSAPIFLHLGLLPYQQALKIMQKLHEQVVSQSTHPGYILLVEHPLTITMGNRDNVQDLKVNLETLKALQVEYFKTDRGGSVTVHEPGQLVVYPLLRLDAKIRTVKSLVWLLEEVMILLCADYNILAQRDPINPGIWVGNNKIGALGLRVDRHVTRHGFALNVTNSLRTFDLVVPCGLLGRGVTSLKQQLDLRTNSSVTLIQEHVQERIVSLFLRLFAERFLKIHNYQMIT